MSKVTFEQIRELLGENADLMSAGYLLTNCPWHDDREASLLVYPDGWWVCLGECATHGPNYKLYAELSSPGTTARGRRDIPIGRPPYLPTTEEEQVEFVTKAHSVLTRNASFRWYPETRGIEGRIEPCELGWHEGWLVLPVKSEDNEITGIIIRSGPQAEKLTGIRFSQPSGQRSMVYCPDWSLTLRDPGPLYIVFGMIDALTLSELRLPVLTTTGGAKSFDPKWLNKYSKKIMIIPDKGEESQAYELAAGLDWRGHVKLLAYPDGFKDPNDYAMAGKSDQLLRELIGV